VLNRRGASLAELLLAMTLAAAVLAAASGTLLRQRRSADSHASRVRAESQVRAALGELEAALAGLSPAAGDLAAGEARDTAIQVRSVIASAIACDSTVAAATIASSDTSDDRASGIATAPRAGDTLWWHSPGSLSWVGRRVTALSATTGACAPAGGGPQALLRVGFALPDTVPEGAPLRLTRTARYSFYRAGDGTWQLGISEWSDVLHSFAVPQPVAGPFVLAAPGGGRSGFRYFDSAGGELTDGGAGVSVARVARVRVALVAPEGTPGIAATAFRRDSVDIALAGGP
jgi:hypothetical protein